MTIKIKFGEDKFYRDANKPEFFKDTVYEISEERGWADRWLKRGGEQVDEDGTPVKKEEIVVPKAPKGSKGPKSNKETVVNPPVEEPVQEPVVEIPVQEPVIDPVVENAAVVEGDSQVQNDQGVDAL